MNIFLENLEKHLKKQSRKRPWLSKKTEIPLSTINSWFSKNSLPNVSDAIKIAKLLNISLDFLLTGENPSISNDPVLSNIIGFLEEQNQQTLIKIEDSLSMFNYLNITQNIIPAKEPILILDKELYIQWVNEEFIINFGNKSNFVGLHISQISSDHTFDADNQKGLIALDDSNNIAKRGFPLMLNNLSLVPIFKSSNENFMPVAYIGTFIGFNKENKLTPYTTFLKLLEILKLKNKRSNSPVELLSRYTKMFATKLKEIPEYPEINDEYIENLSRVAPLHDIGNIGISDDILNKHNKLENWEWEVIKAHTVNGAYILSAYSSPIGKMVALQHHEWWDGSGYPYGLSADMINLGAQIVSICVSYNILRNKQHYRDEYSHEDAIEIINNETGTHFNPLLIEKFLKIEKDFKDLSFYKESEKEFLSFA